MKLLLNALVVGAITVVAATTSVQPSHAQAAANNQDTCSSFGANSLTVQNQQVLLSHDAGGAFIGPIDLAVPAGTYNITGVSYDEHSAKPNQEDQINETWYVEGWYDGQHVYTSGTTDDLPNDQDYNSTSIGADAQVPQLDSIRFVHAAFPDPLYESVIPSCVNFEEAQVAAVPTVPTTPTVPTPSVNYCDPAAAFQTITSDVYLLSHDEGGAYIGPVAVTIEAGNYAISATSYDDHSSYSDPRQDHEQWYFEGWSNGQLVYSSNTTNDLPDDQDYIVSDLGTAELPQIDAIRYVHAAFQNPDYHSVVPSCIQLEQLAPTDDGDVLGDVDEKNDNVGGDNTGPTGGNGEVLGETESLAATGVPAGLVSVIGVGIGAASLTLGKLARTTKD